jgi:hypothetical protein
MQFSLQVFRLIQGAGDGLVKEAGGVDDGFLDVPEGPPPLVKCAQVHPLAPELRPVILRRQSGRPDNSSVFQYKADLPAAKALQPKPEAEEQVFLHVLNFAIDHPIDRRLNCDILRS